MRTAPALSLLLAAAFAVAATAQQPTFKAGVEAVRVDVSVTDHGKPVRGLTAANFAITDNGSAVPVTSVTVEQLPLRVVLALDTSGSVQGKALTTLVDASRGLMEALRPTDRIAVLTFAGEVRLVSGFDANRSVAYDALAHVEAGGSTSLYDALQVALGLISLDDQKAADARPLIVVCTDGFDTGSWLRGDQVIQATQRADVVVDTIEPPGSPEYGLVKQVDTLAALSGGRTWSAKSERDLKGLFTQTLSDMRDRYLLTFSPQIPLRQGWHDLTVTLRNAHGDVLARPGYYVGTGGA